MNDETLSLDEDQPLKTILKKKKPAAKPLSISPDRAEETPKEKVYLGKHPITKEPVYE